MCSVENIGKVDLRLPAEGVSQDFQSGFGQHLIGSTGTQTGTDRSFECAEETFHSPAAVVTLLPDILWRHLPPPFSSRRAIGPSWHRRNDAGHAPLFATVLV